MWDDSDEPRGGFLGAIFWALFLGSIIALVIAKEKTWDRIFRR